MPDGLPPAGFSTHLEYCMRFTATNAPALIAPDASTPMKATRRSLVQFGAS